jgi:HEAT repeat protein
VVAGCAAELEEPVDSNRDSERPRPLEPNSPVEAGTLDTLEPLRARHGELRFVGPAIRTPEAAPLLLARLEGGQDTPEIRRALADAIGRTGGDYAAAVADLVTAEADPDVRALLVASLARAGRGAAADVRSALITALADPVEHVREEAAYVAAAHPAGRTMVGPLIAALSDRDARVRAAAARTLGVLRDQAALGALRPLLADGAADVRLAALRALKRLDRRIASCEAAALTGDPDPRIRRLSGELTGLDH